MRISATFYGIEISITSRLECNVESRPNQESL